MEKSKYWNKHLEKNDSGVFIFHYSFILFLHMRELSPEKCELVNIWKYCKGGNSSGTLTFSLFIQGGNSSDTLTFFFLSFF